jgi:murein DD-endopeptidase MepM/ murein hydrolase activator NlpD
MPTARTRRRQRGRPIAAIVFSFYAGIFVGWCVHATTTPKPVFVATVDSTRAIAPTDGAPAAAAGRPVGTSGAIDELRRRDLEAPIDGVDVESFKGSFAETRRGDGGHPHEAVDILAPRGTPVHAIEDGTIARLFNSKAGGNTIYQFDPTERFCYYYAHLDRYARGLHDGQGVSAGEVIGYVGTTGNAPPGTPHLHLAIFALGPEKRWWEGTALDPYLVFTR